MKQFVKCVKCKQEKHNFSYALCWPCYDFYKKKREENQAISEIRKRYCSYSNFAKEKNREFLISFNFFTNLVKSPCFYCGDFSKTNINGIDRTDNSIGYIESNCVSCCWTCNRMKNSLGKEEFLFHCSKIANKRIQNDSRST